MTDSHLADSLKVLVVCKRAPQQRDLLARPYGRFHHLPAELAARGREVRVLLPNLRRGADEQRHFSGVDWRSRTVTLNPLQTLDWVKSEASEFRPDWVIGFSDTWCGWLALRAARHCKARLLVDAYDDYEAYMPWNLPLHHLWRSAVHKADRVTAAGPQLAAKLDSLRQGRTRSEILPMVADAGFVPMDRTGCRARLSLPAAAPLLGYFGGWGEARGTHLLLDAFRRVQAIRPDARLVLSGRPPIEVSGQPGVIALGYLPDDDLPVVLNAMDVACVISASTRFGRYSYPVKLCEAMACGVPVVATATDPIRWMLADHPGCLVPVGDAEAFAQRALSLLEAGRFDYGPPARWPAIATALDAMLSAPGADAAAPGVGA